METAVIGASKCYGLCIILQSILKRKFVVYNKSVLSISAFVFTLRSIEGYYRRKHNIQNAKVARFIASCIGFGILKADGKGETLLAYAIVQGFNALQWKKSVHEVVKLSVVSGPLIYIWAYAPGLLDKSHLKNLDYYCGMPKEYMVRVRKGLRLGGYSRVCQVTHPEVTCHAYHRLFLKSLLKRSAMVYIPILAVTHGVLRWKMWTKRPMKSLMKMVKQYTRSCVCLALFYQIPMMVTCWLPMFRHQPKRKVWLAGHVAALAVFVESKSRRTSIVAIIWSYMLVAFGRYVQRFTVVQWIQSKNVLHKLMQTIVFGLCSMTALGRLEKQNATFMHALYGYPISTKKKDAKAINTKMV